MRASLVITLLLFVCLPCCAQRRQEPLSDQEVEQLRDNAVLPDKRIAVFQKIIDARVDRIQELAGKKYEAGRVEDLHDWMQQVADIAGELEENLETYEQDHRDLRKVLPKLIAATERWKSVLNQPEKNETYEIVRQFAVDSVADVQKEATELLPNQKEYFKQHPPRKEEDRGIEVER